MSVLIIGGGIGGLAAAVALRRAGIAAQVFERAPQIREVGAGLTIWSPAVTALRRMGLEEQVMPLGPEIDRFKLLSPGGQVISSTNIDDISRASGAASLVVHRADLQRVLLEALPPEQVHTEKECREVIQDQDGVTVRFADGTEARGSIVVGADGIRSAVAASLFGEENLRFAGYYCYRAMAATPEFRGNEVISILLPGMQFGLFPRVRQAEAYWFLCRNSPPGAGAPEDRRNHSALLESIAARLPVDIGDMIAHTDSSRILIDDVFDRPPRRHWGRGRVTLLGDAAHPTTPTYGQGACMAIEDAVFLANSLQRLTEPVAALRDYEERRRKRTAMITNLSWRYGNFLQYERPALVQLRRLMLATPFSRWNLRRILRRTLTCELPELSPRAKIP